MPGPASWGPAADAPEVFDIRVRQLAGRTRIIFELQAATHYQIEHSDAPGGKKLLVSLYARTYPELRNFAEGQVASLRVQQRANKTVARIELRRADQAIEKKMLTNPARLVIDVLAESNGSPSPITNAAP